MSTAAQPEQHDQLIACMEIELTSEQLSFLKENIKDLRTLLLKKFNFNFGTQYTKLQINRALEVMNKPQERKPYKANREKPRNVYYKRREKCWEARVTIKKQRILLYTGSEEMAIRAVKEFRENLLERMIPQ